MQTLKLAARPLLLVLVWMVVSAHTISELATVGRALHAAPAMTMRVPRPQSPFAQARSAPRP